MEVEQIAAGYLRERREGLGAAHLLDFMSARSGVRFEVDRVWAVYREVLEQAEGLVTPEVNFQIRWWEVVPFLNEGDNLVVGRIPARTVAEDMANFSGVRSLIVEWLAGALAEGREWLAVLVTDISDISGDLDVDASRHRAWSQAVQRLTDPSSEIDLSAVLTLLEAASLVVPEAGFEYARLNASIPQAPGAWWASLVWAGSAGNGDALRALAAADASTAPSATRLALLLGAAALGDPVADEAMRSNGEKVFGDISEQQYADARELVLDSRSDQPYDLAVSEAFERLLAAAAERPNSPAGMLLSAALVNSGGHFRHALVESWRKKPQFRWWVTGLVREQLNAPDEVMASEFLWQVFEWVIAKSPLSS